MINDGWRIKETTGREKVPEDCPVCISHSELQNAYYTIDKIELSNGFYDDKNHGILLRARE